MGEVDLRSLNRTLGEMIARASNPSRPLTEIGVLMVSEMQENFRVGGRPEAWPVSKRAARQGGQTLRDTGTLMTGIISELDGTSVAAGPTMVGRNHITDPRVMKLLAYGGRVTRSRKAKPAKGGRARKTLGSVTMNYPKRDYTFIPPDSMLKFGEIMQGYLVR